MAILATISKKYLKENMQNEFLIRKTKNPNMITGWEFERNKFNELDDKFSNETQKRPQITFEVGENILYSLNRFENALKYDDELAEILAIAELTALTCVGVYLLIEKLRECGNEIEVDELKRIVEEVYLEDNLEYIDEENLGFNMFM